MKTINQYIKESLLDDEEDLVDSSLYQPKDKNELIETIINCLNHQIYDLNYIDTSLIKDMSDLSRIIGRHPLNKHKNKFNKIDISNWDVSNVKDMRRMFANSEFNGDISKWNVSNVKYMNGMFEASKFNRDISKWNISNGTTTNKMF